MTAQEFLRWLEKGSMDPSCKSSLGEQVGLMRVEIMDVNAEVFQTAIENLAELNHQFFDSVRCARRALVERTVNVLKRL